MDHQHDQQAQPAGQQQKVQQVLQRPGDRTSRQDLLKLPERHDAAGDGESTEEHFEAQGGHRAGRKGAGRGEQHVFVDAHQGGRHRAGRMGQRHPLRHRGHRHRDEERPTDHDTDDRTRQEAPEDPGVAYDLGVDQGAYDGEQHADGGIAHPGSRLLRTAQSPKPDDEKDRAHQVGALDDQVAQRKAPGHLGFRSSRLNILSMRSVMRNPPTTFTVAQITATKPMALLRVP